eukprot:scaffold201508_cov22-Tisochrysis_lutea.AAC.1
MAYMHASLCRTVPAGFMELNESSAQGAASVMCAVVHACLNALAKQSSNIYVALEPPAMLLTGAPSISQPMP